MAVIGWIVSDMVKEMDQMIDDAMWVEWQNVKSKGRDAAIQFLQFASTNLVLGARIWKDKHQFDFIEVDQNILNNIFKGKYNRFIKYLGLSQALIDVQATPTYKEIYLSKLGFNWDRYCTFRDYTYSGNGIIMRDKLENDCKKEYEKMFPEDDNDIVMFLVNRYSPSDITVRNKIIKEGKNRIGGKAFDLGSKYLSLYDGFDDSQTTIIHEVLHCLGLRHSFDKNAKHTFKAYHTGNFINYVNNGITDNRKQLWKWQWEELWSYLD